MTHTTCPKCGGPVIRAPRLGMLLDAQPHPCGIWLPAEGGTRLTTVEALQGRSGHHRHTCPPPAQIAMFDDPGQE